MHYIKITGLIILLFCQTACEADRLTLERTAECASAQSEQFAQPGLDIVNIPAGDPEAPPPPSHKERRMMAKAVLDILNKNLSEGKLNYKFNHSGEGVLLSGAGLAFLSCGSTLQHGDYSIGLQRILARMRSIMDGNKFQFQPTWGSGASCIFLSELHRVTNGKEKTGIAELLQKYVDKLVAAQTPVGGWCHGFENVKNSLGYSHFMFVSSIATHGLALARREGAKVPADVLQKAFGYFEASSNIGAGRIGYSPNGGQKGMRGPGRTAGGLLALQAAGEVERELYKNASKYLLSTLSIQSGKNSLPEGHGSAQVGLACAAWWCAETGNYDAFWQGQGASIAKRRKADGGFNPAPSDGKAQGVGNSESGDFSNAFHALMLVADYGGLSNSRVSRADPARSIFLAQQYIKEHPDATVPDSFKTLAETPIQYGRYDFRPLLKTIETVVKDIIAGGDKQLLALVPSLINADFRGKVYAHPAGGKVALVLEGNFVFADRLLSAELLLLNDAKVFPRDQRVIKVKPSKKKGYAKKSVIKTNKDITLPDSLNLQVTWIMGDHKIVETVTLPVMAP